MPSNPLLLVPREVDGETVLEATDTRSIRYSGSSVVTSYPKELMDRIGFQELDDVDDRDVEMRFQLRPSTGEMLVVSRIVVPDTDWLEEVVDDVLPAETDVEENGSDRPLAEH